MHSCCTRCFGGTRTVDVYVRQLWAKLGLEHEALIGMVCNVDYKAVRPGLGCATIAGPYYRDIKPDDFDDLIIDPLRSK